MVVDADAPVKLAVRSMELEMSRSRRETNQAKSKGKQTT